MEVEKDSKNGLKYKELRFNDLPITELCFITRLNPDGREG